MIPISLLLLTLLTFILLLTPITFTSAASPPSAYETAQPLPDGRIPIRINPGVDAIVDGKPKHTPHVSHTSRNRIPAVPVLTRQPNPPRPPPFLEEAIPKEQRHEREEQAVVNNEESTSTTSSTIIPQETNEKSSGIEAQPSTPASTEIAAATGAAPASSPVDTTSSFAAASSTDLLSSSSSSSTPPPFSLPPSPPLDPSLHHQLSSWLSLNHHCFTHTTSVYIYTFCPYQNITQKSLSTNANVHVVLGVYDGWVEERLGAEGEMEEEGDATTTDGTSTTEQTAASSSSTPVDTDASSTSTPTAASSTSSAYSLVMYFNDGTSCARGKSRSTFVYFVCDLESAKEYDGLAHIGDVSEPMMCEYTVRFHTPLMCSEESRKELAPLQKKIGEMQHCIDLLLARVREPESADEGLVIQRCAEFLVPAASSPSPSDITSSSPSSSHFTLLSTGLPSSITTLSALQNVLDGYEHNLLRYLRENDVATLQQEMEIARSEEWKKNVQERVQSILSQSQSDEEHDSHLASLISQYIWDVLDGVLSLKVPSSTPASAITAIPMSLLNDIPVTYFEPFLLPTSAPSSPPSPSPLASLKSSRFYQTVLHTLSLLRDIDDSLSAQSPDVRNVNYLLRTGSPLSLSIETYYTSLNSRDELDGARLASASKTALDTIEERVEKWMQVVEKTKASEEDKRDLIELQQKVRKALGYEEEQAEQPKQEQQSRLSSSYSSQTDPDEPIALQASSYAELDDADQQRQDTNDEL